jgi:hypothetical protein
VVKLKTKNGGYRGLLEVKASDKKPIVSGELSVQ